MVMPRDIINTTVFCKTGVRLALKIVIFNMTIAITESYVI